MLFNSVTFLYFFIAVYLAYLLLRPWKGLQNLLLLVSSYVFYGYWDWRFLLLIALSTVVDYTLGLWIGRTPAESTNQIARRKWMLAASVLVNLSILGFFKYYNFFAEGLAEILDLIGLAPTPFTLNIILPVGISFYTFQTLSYTIDVYRQKLTPTRSLLDFAVFVAFFPQLVAGPIERAVNLLPQIQSPRIIRWEQVYSGLYLMLWGYFKKMVIADNAALISDQVFNNYTAYSGADILLGVLAFSLQIYGDFSGYTDIARGVARLLGFELMLNFRLPYFALSPSDFWRRWHISLSTWLRDYLYIPLGGNRGGTLRTYLNLFITMVLGGLWHGAAWNFVIWGAFHGLILILYRMFEKPPAPATTKSKPFLPITAAKMLFMFVLTLIGWLIFRSTSVHQIGYMLANLSLSASPETAAMAADLAFFAVPLLLVQVYQHLSRDLLAVMKFPVPLRVSLYSLMLLWIAVFGVRASTEFIYFQF